MKNKGIVKILITILAVLSAFMFVCMTACDKEKAPFVVSFNGNGGTLVSGEQVQKVNSSSEIILPTYEREGYTLVGFDKEISRLTEDSIVNAIWKVNSYRINFLANGGTIDTEYIEVEYGQVIGELPVPDKKGHVFSGWKIDSLDGQVLTQGVLYKYTKDITLYATYVKVEEHIYSITYNLNGGSFPANNPTSYKSTDEDITLSNPEKKGYDFVGWLEGDSTQPVFNMVIEKGSSKDLHFTAQFSAKEYTITLNADGGMIDKTSLTVVYDSQIKGLPTPDKDGWTFEGWFIQDKKISNGDVYKYDLDIQLVARYKENQVDIYSIHYNLNGGEVDGVNPTSYKPIDADLTLINPTKQGYEFIGWTQEDSQLPQLVMVIEKGTTGDKVFTANFVALEFKIILNADGGSVDKEYVTVKYEGLIPEIPKPEQQGFAFDGWRKDSVNGELITQGMVYTYLNDITVVAVWKEIEPQTFSITYNTNGADFPEGNPTSYKNSDDDITLVNPQMQGYIFLGWKENADEQPSVNRVIKSGTTGNLVFSAYWQKMMVEINYNLVYTTASGKTITSKINGNATVAPIMVEYGSRISAYLYEFTPDVEVYQRKCWVNVDSENEVVILETATLDLENFPNATIKYQQDNTPYYSITLTAKVNDGYVVYIQMYNYVYNIKRDITFGGESGPITLHVDYGDSLGSRLKEAIPNQKDVVDGIYFKHWYYLKDGKKVKVTSTTVFNEINFTIDEITLIPQLYSYWTPNFG